MTVKAARTKNNFRQLRILEVCASKQEAMEMTEVWKAWKAIRPASHASHTLWKSLRDYNIPTASTTYQVFSWLPLKIRDIIATRSTIANPHKTADPSTPLRFGRDDK
jgi:hypothetical protein